jgi:cobalamin biosynthesis protein CobT
VSAVRPLQRQSTFDNGDVKNDTETRTAVTQSASNSNETAASNGNEIVASNSNEIAADKAPDGSNNDDQKKDEQNQSPEGAKTPANASGQDSNSGGQRKEVVQNAQVADGKDEKNNSVPEKKRTSRIRTMLNRVSSGT